MSNTSGLDAWSVISGAIGVLTVFPLLFAFVWTQHPETKFAQLDSTLKDTENLLRSVVEEGLLDPEGHGAHFDVHLKTFRLKTEQFRDETYIASNEWRKLLGAWYNGLSKRMAFLCKRVKAVRATISETSANARMRLMQQSAEDVLSTPRGWRGKVARLWQCAVSLVFESVPDDIVDAPAPAPVISATSTSSEVDPFAGDATLSSVEAQTVASTDDDSLRLEISPPSSPVKNQKFGRTTRTASKAHDLHVFTRAIRRVDRELAAQGVTNALLTQLVQATHKQCQWSPASSKARTQRRSGKQRTISFSHHPSRASSQTTLQGASETGIDIDIDSDDDSSEEETVCGQD